MTATIEKKTVPLGQLVATPGAFEAMMQAGQSPLEFLQRHQRGDWGEVCADDWNLNDAALEQGDRILSAYQTKNKVRLWVITEWNRSVTTILLPDEY
jgi:hypothetical protein